MRQLLLVLTSTLTLSSLNIRLVQKLNCNNAQAAINECAKLSDQNTDFLKSS